MATPWGISDWQVDFINDPNTAGLVDWQRTWDSVGNVTTWSSDGGLQHELGVYEAGVASAAVDNTNEYLTPGNASSPFNTGGPGGKLVDTYRTIRHWWQPSLTGNLLNDTNLTDWGVGVDNASFETATGTWTANGTTTIVRSAVQFHDGTHSGLVSWATSSTSSTGYVQCALPPTRVGTTYTLSAWVFVTASSTSVKIGCSGSSSAASSGTGSWQRLTLTFTATSAVSGITVFPSAASAAGSQVYLDGIQLEVGSSATAFTTSGPRIYPVFRGYIERYPQSWDSTGFKGYSDLGAVDALALLSKISLRDVMTQDMIQDGPLALFLLDEASTPCVNIGGNVLPPMAEYRVEGVTLVTEVPLNYGVPGPGVEQIGCVSQPADISVSGTVAHYLVSNFMNDVLKRIGNILNGFTFECWFNVATNPSNGGPLVTGDGVGTVAGRYIRLFMYGTNIGLECYNANTTTFDYQLPSTANLNDGRWHHMVGTEEFAGGSNITAKLYVDGKLDSQVTFARGGATMSIGKISAFATLFVGSFEPGVVRGSISRIAAYDYPLSAARVASHYQSAGAFQGDKSGTRIVRILNWAGWKGPTSIQTGVTTVAPATGLAGQTALAASQLCETTEDGVFIASPNGVLTFMNRDWPLLQLPGASVATFGELETPYDPGLTRETDPTLIFNDWSVSRPGGTAPQRVYNQTSMARYFPSTQSVTTQHADDTQALQFATYLLRRFKDSHARWPSVTITPSANPGLFPLALSLRIGDRVTVKRRTSAGVTISEDHLISRITRNGSPTALSFTFSLIPVDPQVPWIMGNATYGIMGQTTRMTY